MSEHGDARAVGDRLHIRARHVSALLASSNGTSSIGRPLIAALGVHLVDCKPRRDQAFQAGRAGRSGQRVGESNADRRRTAPDNGSPSEGKEQDGAHDTGRDNSRA